ncbi:DUF3368 domain-containing protein [Defluviitalea saccharophila]|uniref:DUF3368 domain-containing protein n=1 Tax=Defluviitalea saccharophila TaxID=879970 RepID=A0ABZ2Y7C5_9FIRM
MRKVVVNSTPLISLYKIDNLNLLKLLYDQVYIPYGVYEELSVESKDNFLDNADFVILKKIQNEEAKKFFKTSLHKGEVEVMILAEEINADLCIIDDLLARKYAKYLGLKITGTMGILIKAKEKGYINQIKPLLDQLIYNNIYIDNNLYVKVLDIANETE